MKVDNSEFSSPFEAKKWSYGGCSLRCPDAFFRGEVHADRVAWTNDVKSLASFNFTIPRPELTEKQPQTMTGSFVYLDTSCSVIEEFENTVLLVLGLAQGVCDRSARGTKFAPELFRRYVTGEMRSPWTSPAVVMSKSSGNRVLSSRLCSHFSSGH